MAIFSAGRYTTRRETSLALQSVGSGNSNRRRVTEALEVIRPNPSVLKVQNLIRDSQTRRHGDVPDLVQADGSRGCG